MPAYHVERSITINAPLKKVKNSLADFKQWSKWSPWLVMEPDAALTYSDRQGQVGATYGWAGVLVGAGSMELLKINDHILEMEIIFIKPFKSTARVVFDLTQVGDATKVTWHMYGHLTFFMFWMKEKMRTFVGMDYERGLLMLKEYLEVGSVASYVIIEGVVPMKDQKYIGIPKSCAIKDIGTVMKKDFETLYTFMEENSISMDRVPFSIYNTFDIFKKETSFISCVLLDEEMAIDASWVRGIVENREALKTIHTGSYLHLGNAWTTAISFANIKKIKTSKSPVGYEFYLNNPYDTPEKELITEIYLPLR